MAKIGDLLKLNKINKIESGDANFFKLNGKKTPRTFVVATSDGYVVLINNNTGQLILKAKEKYVEIDGVLASTYSDKVELHNFIYNITFDINTATANNTTANNTTANNTTNNSTATPTLRETVYNIFDVSGSTTEGAVSVTLIFSGDGNTFAGKQIDNGKQFSLDNENGLLPIPYTIGEGGYVEILYLF